MRDPVFGEGHEWVIGRFQADDESECRFCRIDSDDPAAEEPCPSLKARAQEADRG